MMAYFKKNGARLTAQGSSSKARDLEQRTYYDQTRRSITENHNFKSAIEYPCRLSSVVCRLSSDVCPLSSGL